MNEDTRVTSLLLLGIGLSVATLELVSGWAPPYGLFHDEFYYWAGALRPGFGYVDHPPLAPWVLSAILPILGDGRLGFGLAPAACAAGSIYLTGRIARSLGAGRFGQLLAALAAAVAPVYLIFFSFYSVNCFDVLFWAGAIFLVVELIRTGDERFWLGFGVIAGFALLNKHTFLLLVAGLAIGMLATPMRQQLRTRSLWLGAAIALLIAAPNLLWNMLNGWPSLEFYATRGAGILDATIGQALEIQVIAMNPANLVLWIPGLAFLLFSNKARPFRPLGIAFLVLFIGIIFFGQKRGDRIVGIYPIVFAAGAVAWESWEPPFRAAIRGVLVILLCAFGVFLLPISLPILPPANVVRFFEAIGESPEIETGDEGAGLPLYFSGRLEWERFAREVIDVWQTLSPDERARSAILTSHWVYASVIEYYARDGERPTVVSPHNAYYFWRHEATGRNLVLSVDVHPGVLAESFENTREIASFHCEHCTHVRGDSIIRLSRGPRKPLEALLQDWRHFGITKATRLTSLR